MNLLFAVLFVVLKLVALVAGGVALFTVFCYGVLLRSLWGRPLPPRLSSAIVGEYLVSVLIILLWPLGWLRQGPHLLHRAAGPAGGRRPVLLLHGYGMNSTSWVWFGRRLRQLGFGSLYTTTYFSPLSVERSAARLGKMVEHIRHQSGGMPVDIIAHSLGGLVSRYFIERLAPAGAAPVANLVTIGTPHHGTVLSRFGLGPVAPQLGAAGAFLAALGPARPPPGVRYLSIFSSADQMVVPCESASIAADPHPGKGPAAVADLPLDGLGHLMLLCSPRVAEAAAQALRILANANANDNDTDTAHAKREARAR